MQKLFQIDEGIKVTLIGSAINLALSILKFAAGRWGRSTAMVADAFHSFSDLLTDAVVLFTYRIGKIPKDDNHPYGHGRAETIGAAITGGAIVQVGLGLLYDVWSVLKTGKTETPLWIAPVIALVGIASKEWLYRYTRVVGEKLRSPSIVANAWEHRSDAWSSLAALVGIAGAMFGYPIMDPLAGGVVSLMIVKAGFTVLKDGLRDLMDSALDETQIEKIRETINATGGVRHSHDLRSRRIGGEILLDFHILVDPEITVTEGHNIAENVRCRLRQAFDDVQDILIHVDAEDDRKEGDPYPTSKEELRGLADPVIVETQGIVGRTLVRVHYLKGKNIVEIFLRMDKSKTIGESEAIVNNLKTRLRTIDGIDDVKVYLDVDDGAV